MYVSTYIQCPVKKLHNTLNGTLHTLLVSIYLRVRTYSHMYTDFYSRSSRTTAQMGGINDIAAVSIGVILVSVVAVSLAIVIMSVLICLKRKKRQQLQLILQQQRTQRVQQYHRCQWCQGWMILTNTSPLCSTPVQPQVVQSGCTTLLYVPPPPYEQTECTVASEGASLTEENTQNSPNEAQ